jgi:hypothetical protein
MFTPPGNVRRLLYNDIAAPGKESFPYIQNVPRRALIRGFHVDFKLMSVYNYNYKMTQAAVRSHMKSRKCKATENMAKPLT